MSEKISFDVSAGETPEFLKPSKPEKEPGFIRLADVIEGFMGKAKITEQIWRAMFPQGLATQERMLRVQTLKRALKDRPDAVFEDVSDLLLLGVPVSESDAHFQNNKKPFSPIYRRARVDVPRDALDDDRTRVLSSLASDSGSKKGHDSLGAESTLVDKDVDDSSIDIPVDELQMGSGSNVEDDAIPVEQSLEESDDDQFLKAIDGARTGYLAGKLRANTPVDTRPFDLATAKQPFPQKRQESGVRPAENVPHAEASRVLTRAELEEVLGIIPRKKSPGSSTKRI